MDGIASLEEGGECRGSAEPPCDPAQCPPLYNPCLTDGRCTESRAFQSSVLHGELPHLFFKRSASSCRNISEFQNLYRFLAVADRLAAGQRDDRLCVGALGLWADEQCAFRIAADPLFLCALCAGERVCRSSPQKEHHALHRYRCVPVYAFNCGAFAAEPAQCTVDLSG